MEFFLIIVIVYEFIKAAAQKGQSQLRWGLFGAASYFVPIFFSNLVLYFLLKNGFVQFNTPLALAIFKITLNVSLGILSSVWLFHRMIRKTETEKKQHKP